jgi:hypothetical protein
LNGDQHFLQSSFREKALEHIFIGDLLRRLWVRGVNEVEILKAEVDATGYDIVIEASGILRHIQLKASYNGSTVRQQGIHSKLSAKPGGCVVWLGFDADTLDLGPFYWFGAAPGHPLPDIIGFKKAKHTKANAEGVKSERANTYMLKRTACEKLETLDGLIDRLFGLSRLPVR